MELMIALLVGIGLAAAAGLRIFLPLFGLALGSWLNYIPVQGDMVWLATPAAVVALGAATILEIGGYYFPLVDHLLDTVAAPGAIIAGTLMTASLITGIDQPMLQWSLALIAGGGTAGIVQAGSMLARATSTATTGGLGNPVVATGEWLGSLALTLTAILAPLLIVLALAGLGLWAWRRRISSR
ncbi:MAG TPA: DUF4126 domain-containing protein [Moraxellaceae bacterium]|nr:DUF4126 domain-containing protein [Moraxellaceae bacterium]